MMSLPSHVRQKPRSLYVMLLSTNFLLRLAPRPLVFVLSDAKRLEVILPSTLTDELPYSAQPSR